jgi:glutaredoxin 3
MPPRVTVYGSACPACTQAKAVLDRHGLVYDEQPMSRLPRRYGRVRSMPQIVVDDDLVGGVNALLRLARSGGLARIAAGDMRPWVEVTRRVGRGFDVIVRDRIGRETGRTRVRTRERATALAAELEARTADP